MDARLLNAADYGALPGNGLGEHNSTALQKAIDELGTAGGGTLFIPEGVYEFTGNISIAVNTEANCSGTLRITGDRMPTLLQAEDGNIFVVMETASGRVGRVILEGLQFQGRVETPTS
ncbi:MAG: hypothetical protein WB608_14580 [Terracidiphilus sp.]